MKDLREIAKFAKAFHYKQVSGEIVDRAKLLILDSIAAIVKGNQSQEVISLCRSIRGDDLRNKNEIPVLGMGEYLDFQNAAFINGIGMVADELDEGNPLAKGHPAAHFLPALLSIAYKLHLTGEAHLLLIMK